jgi:hypothetical protein
LDPDGDGLTHLDEALLGSLPFAADTDGDCILDGLEVARASANPDGPSATARLTMVDADGDGVDDHVAEGCDEEGPEEPTVRENGTSNQTLDLDRDGVEDAVDRCPSTPTDELVDADGCSADQRRDLLSVGESSDGGMGWVVPAMAVVGALVALVGLLGLRQRAPSVGKDVSIPVALQHERPRPVLDGREQAGTDLRSRLVGWEDALIDERLSEGWTLEQLVEYYEQQQ